MLARLLFVDRLECLAGMAMHLHADGIGVLHGAVSKQLPVLIWNKGADLALALHHQLHRHRLDATGGQATGNLVPEQRRHHKTDYPIEKTPRLLRFNPMHIQLGRLLERFLNSLLGNFVKHHPIKALVLTTDDFLQVPGDGLSLAVQVGGEIDGVSLGRQTLELINDLFLARQDLVASRPTVLGINAHAVDQLIAGLARLVPGSLLGGQRAGNRRLAGTLRRGAFGRSPDRQIAHMANTRFDDKVIPEVAIDGARLGGRLDDYQIFSHRERNLSVLWAISGRLFRRSDAGRSRKCSELSLF